MGDKARIGVITETSKDSFILGRLNFFGCGTLKWTGHQDFNVRPRSFLYIYIYISKLFKLNVIGSYCFNIKIG